MRLAAALQGKSDVCANTPHLVIPARSAYCLALVLITPVFGELILCSQGIEKYCVHTVAMSCLLQLEKLQPKHESHQCSQSIAVVECPDSWNWCTCWDTAAVS